MRAYYNQRVGKDGEPPKLTIQEISEQLAASYRFLEQQNLLQRSFGYGCVDAHQVPGLFGIDPRTHFYLKTGIQMEASVLSFIEDADEVGLFTLIEFLFDHVATPDPRSGYHHTFADCGWHYDCRRDKFHIQSARQEWRDTVNGFLKFYEDGYDLSADGEVTRVAPDGLADMFQFSAPSAAGGTNAAKPNNAVRTFRRGLSSREEQKGAVRDLADLLEFYRPRVKTLLLKDDEAALFTIANSYAIRHHREDQKDNYDGPWLAWLFYLYLSTVHLILTLIHGQQEKASSTDAEERSEPPNEDDDIPF